MEDFKNKSYETITNLMNEAGKQKDAREAYRMIAHMSLSVIAQVMDAMDIEIFEINEKEFSYRASKIPAEIYQEMQEITKEVQKEINKTLTKH